MKLSGYLSEYSLAEIFSLIHEGNQTGLLTLIPKQTVAGSRDIDHLWFDNGRIIAVTNGLSGIELLTKIAQRKLISPDQIESVGAKIYQLSQPLGLYLKDQGLLDSGQLKLIFNAQTVTPACKLFEIKDRAFMFDDDKSPMNAEITGISVSAQKVGLLGLRLLKDWSGLSAKLADPNHAFKRRFSQQPDFELNRHELQLWTLADGKTPLTQVAEKMSLSIDSVRQIGFCLSTFGSIEEVSISSAPIDNLYLTTSIPVPKSQLAPMSNSFLGNLKKFLKIRA